jgi:protein TonB
MRYSLLLLLSIVCLVGATPLHAQLKKKGKNVIKNIDGTISTGKSVDYKRTGLWVTKTASGRLVKETEYKDDLKNGVEKVYFSNGGVGTITNYSYDVKNGSCLRFNTQGDTLLNCSFLNNQFHGAYSEIKQQYNQTVYLRGTYNLGKREGLYVIRTVRPSKNEVELDSTWYEHDKKNGKSVLYLNDKLVQSGNYIQNRKDGEHRAYYLKKPQQLQSLINYSDGRNHGVSISYYESGNIMSVMRYSAGMKTGCDTTWFDKSRSIMNTVCYHVNGNPRNICEYSEQGYLKSRTFYSDKRHITDSSFVYGSNGRIINEWHRNQIAGFRTVEYYPNGKVKAKGDYLSESKHGQWIYYDSTGKKIKEKTYSSGSVYGWYVDYYPNGKIRYKAKCIFGVPNDSITAFDSKGKKLSNESKEFNAIQDDIITNDKEISLSPRDTDWMAHTSEGEYDVVEIAEAPEPNEDEIYVYAEEMPQYPGGSDSLKSYLRRNLQYPEMEKDAGIQGTVYMTFVVRKDGRLTDVKVIKEVPGAPGLTKEAARLINGMPYWIPGKMNGRAVNISVTIPIKFMLQD